MDFRRLKAITCARRLPLMLAALTAAGGASAVVEQQFKAK